MPILLARVDDRLIHGQVVHGWGAGLRADLYVLVSDALRADPGHAELYLLAVPEPARGLVASVEEACGPALGAELERRRSIVLFADLGTARRALEAALPIRDLNLGGLHHAPGKHAVLPYLFLDADDRLHLRAIADVGVRVVAQDLPGNPAHALEAILGKA